MRIGQSGIFLISAAIAVGIVGMLITFFGVQQSRQMRIERAERIGESLKVIGNAVETFTVKHHGDIEKVLSGTAGSFSAGGETFTVKGTPGPGATTEIADLNATRLIKALALPGVGATPPRGVGEYRLHVYRICDAGSTSSCRIETLAYLTEPIKKLYSSEPDLSLAIVAAKKIGVYGGLSMPDNAGEFRFIEQVNGALPVANPLGRPGLIAMRGGSQTKDLNNVVTRDGSRAMTGDLNFLDPNTSQKHSIVGVHNIKAEGALDVGQLNIADKAVARELNAATLSTDSLTTKGPSRFGGSLDMGKENVTNAKTIEAQEVKSKRLRSTSGIVELNEVQAVNDECKGSGIAVNGDGRVLSCQPDDKSMTGRLWKLSGTANSKADVPDNVLMAIAKETITDMVLVGIGRGERWNISKVPVGGTAWIGGNRYRPALKGYSASNVVLCGFSSRSESHVGSRWSNKPAKLERDSAGKYTLAGASKHPLLCLWRYDTNAARQSKYYGAQGAVFKVDELFDVKGVVNYSSDHVEFERWLADLTLGLGGIDMNRVGTHVIGKRVWYPSNFERLALDTGYFIKKARMCNVETFFRVRGDNVEYGLGSFHAETRNDGMYVSYSNLPFSNYLRATCRFDSLQDVRDADFDEVL
ncbi:hypothetical protein [Pandoraea fibrosis]|uniref:Shufflon system plasmid conjugative transfer pilus tip adhesin PilV n=1 Tax=Pandoraea fibrosis TaxID=1891094 RepID=A0A5E4WDJ6_9BURK|nr:hypothetical protein [Pandoraea fibrosis]VVE22668.1 hypothetical protein PFI31113_03195 [Pandoraea fibrosis]